MTNSKGKKGRSYFVAMNALIILGIGAGLIIVIVAGVVLAIKNR